MPGKSKHTEKFDRCVEEVQAKGHDQSSAYAICTTSFQNSGQPTTAEGHPEMKAAEHIGEIRDLHLLGATGQVRYEQLNGRRHMVVPIVALMEGVIHPVNAATPEFVPLDTLKKLAPSFVGRPVMLGHPKRGGKQCSADDPEIRKSAGLGVIMKSEVSGKKLLQEAWLDDDRVKQLHPDMHSKLAAGKTEEVSVGAFVVAAPKEGTYGPKSYKFVWNDGEGDHLAFLPGGRGACSCDMGCGTHRAATHFVAAEGIETEDLLYEMLFEVAAKNGMTKECAMCKGLGNLGGNPCPACDGEGTLLAKTLAGARHSTSDMKMIQAVHDYSSKLGAKCDGNLEDAEARQSEIKAAESNRPLIRQEGTQWILYSKDGARRLASHSTESDANEQADAIERVLAKKCG